METMPRYCGKLEKEKEPGLTTRLFGKTEYGKPKNSRLAARP
jgi:hypothetical protein